jgi:hypothetical protein
MDHITFMVTVFCIIDDWLKTQPRVRQRGPQPELADSEVLTIEVVGEFLGLDTDTDLYQHFGRYYSAWFPRLRRVDRVTFARQGANLWHVKERLWQHLLTQIDFDPAISVVDSFPVPVCRFARAYRCRRLAAMATYGYDELAKQTFYGLRAHVRIGWPGVIVAVELTPANVHDVAAAEDLAEGLSGWILGDRNYWSPALRDRLAAQNLTLLAPYKSAQRAQQPWPHWLTQMRRRVETVIGQLVGRYHAKKVWARDLWHLSARWLRKILSHTFAFLLCQRTGLSSPLRFAELVTD